MILVPLSYPNLYNIDMSSRVLLLLIYINDFIQLQSTIDHLKSISYRALNLSTKKSHAKSTNENCRSQSRRG